MAGAVKLVGWQEVEGQDLERIFQHLERIIQNSERVFQLLERVIQDLEGVEGKAEVERQKAEGPGGFEIGGWRFEIWTGGVARGEGVTRDR